MLHVILLILKIIGITLLAILGLLIFIILVVLLVPIRYKVDAEHGDELLKVNAKASWLLHLLNAQVTHLEGILHIRVKVLWITLYDNLKPKQPKDKVKKAKRIKKVKEDKINNVKIKKEKANKASKIKVSKDIVGDEKVIKEKVIKEKVSKEKVSKEKVSKEKASKEIIGKEIKSKEIKSKDLISKEIISTGKVSNEIVSVEKSCNEITDNRTSAEISKERLLAVKTAKIEEDNRTDIIKITEETVNTTKSIKELSSLDPNDKNGQDNIVLNQKSSIVQEIKKDGVTIVNKQTTVESSQETIQIDQDRDSNPSFFTKILLKIKNLKEKVISFKNRIKSFFINLKEKLIKLFKTATNFKQKIELISDFIKDELNRQGFKVTYSSLKRILKHILPQKLKSRITFGTGDPCSTGQALGFMGILYSFYGDKVHIIPDFENKVFEGKHYARGRIRLVTLLIIVIKLILDKRFQLLKKNFQLLKEAL